jgi:hypothetical protein
MRLAIYCFARNEAGTEETRLDIQEKAGREYAASRACLDGRGPHGHHGAQTD